MLADDAIVVVGFVVVELVDRVVNVVVDVELVEAEVEVLVDDAIVVFSDAILLI